MFRNTFSVLMIAISAFTLAGCQNTKAIEQTHSHSIPMKNGINNTEKPATIDEAYLSRYAWQLNKATDAKQQLVSTLNDMNSQVTLNFGRNQDASIASFSVGCNYMSGNYSLTNNVLKINSIMSTQMICEDLEDAERLVSNLMHGNSRLSLSLHASVQEASKLIQTTSNGYTLVWDGIQTPEARYQQTGETVFWEINSAEQTCPDAMSHSCLQVRPIYYDERGIKTGYGEWSLFVGNIEGYTHNKSLNQIVRLKRFTVDPSDVKGKQFVYVFDTVVESGVAE